MQKILLWLVFVGLISVPLIAQDSPHLEVFGGYQYQTVGGDLDSQIGSPYNGWDAAVTFNITKHFGLTGDFSGNYHNGTFAGDNYHTHILTFAGGPVFSFGSGGPIKPFVHALVGEARVTTPNQYNSDGSVDYETDSAYVAMFGGGVDFKLKKNIAIRLGQFDWIYYHSDDLAALMRGSSSGFTSNVRISTGIVFRF